MQLLSRKRQLDVVCFGQQLFVTGDLDPVYLALPKAVNTRSQLARWLLAYWLFYSTGFACWASERQGQKFWEVLSVAAINEKLTPFQQRWPRGAERRHFRGSVAIEAITRLRKQYTQPEEVLDYLLSGPLDICSVIKRARQHYLFGPWIAFKIADMLDAVGGVSVEQNDLSAFLYETPRQSILENWYNGVLPLKANTEVVALEEAMCWLAGQLKDCRIPHRPRSAPDWFSLETVWCKHLSHLHGHYPLLKDTQEIGLALQPWCPHSATAKRFLEAMPKS